MFLLVAYPFSGEHQVKISSLTLRKCLLLQGQWNCEHIIHTRAFLLKMAGP